MKNMFLRVPQLIILEAMLTVSPNTQYLNITVPTIPADTGPGEKL